MSTISSSNFIKAGGLIGFSLVFLLVLIKDGDVVAALLEASIACVILGMVFKLFHGFALNLHREASMENRAQSLEKSTEEHFEQLTDGQNRT